MPLPVGLGLSACSSTPLAWRRADVAVSDISMSTKVTAHISRKLAGLTFAPITASSVASLPQFSSTFCVPASQSFFLRWNTDFLSQIPNDGRAEMEPAQELGTVWRECKRADLALARVELEDLLI